MPRTFISYRREDSAGYAGRLHEELEERFGRQQVFRDVDTLRAGQDFEAAIRQRLAQCQACVVMIGPGWLKAQTSTGERRIDQAGDYVAMEIAAALARPEVAVVPVLVGGATMPSPDDLPERLRPLARRHALTARDETWEADMDRLAAVLGTSAPGGARDVDSRPTSKAMPRYLVPAALVALVLLSGTAYLLRGSGSGPSDAVAGVDDGAADGVAYAIDVPASGNEVSHGDIIYAVLSGSVQRRGQGMRVWFRVRGSNEGFTDANFWDDSFRLVAGGQTIAPSSQLNVILEKRSIRQEVIWFDVPSAVTAATLRIRHQGASGDIPLDLSSNGSAARHDEPDPRDALSHAVLSSVLRDEAPLVSASDTTTTTLRISRRAFLNKQRITVVVKWVNGGRAAVSTGDLVARLDVGGETVAPTKMPSEVVEAGATYIGDIVFEVPPTTKTATLKASLKESTVDVPLTLY
jgi:hypothetical protein